MEVDGEETLEGFVRGVVGEKVEREQRWRVTS
jgi:hypothetical protein